MQLLKDLLKRVNKVSLNNGDVPELEEVEKEGARVVGELPVNLRKLFVVRSQMGDELKLDCEISHKRLEKMLSRSRSEASAEDLALARQHVLAHKRYDFVNDFFWLSVVAAFDELALTKESIGIRKDWKVVALKPKARSAADLEMVIVGPFRL
jgi:hypothetical protein